MKILNEKLNLLIVDDDPLWIITLEHRLSKYGNIRSCTTCDAARVLMKRHRFDIAFLDLDIEQRLDGLQLVREAKDKGIYSIITTANNDDETISKGYQVGGHDYLVKPISQEAIDEVFKKFHFARGEDNADTEIQKKFLTKDPETLETVELVKKIHLSNRPVLILGESGTGKTSLAELIHSYHYKEQSPFVSINCSQFNESTLSSELFGYKKGAFTGAIQDKDGLIKQADGGTLFLDEVHSLDYKAQQKLMRVIEDGVYYPVGSEKAEKSNFRLICATCEPIEELISEGRFRKDLYYRIRTFQLYLKPLRDRACDIIPLFNFYLDKKSRKMTLSNDVKKLLQSYEFPSNTREIQDLIENWHIQGLGVITVDDLPFEISGKIKSSNFLTSQQLKYLSDFGFKEFIDEIKKQAIMTALKETKGKQNQAAKHLQVSKSFLSKSINKIQGDQHVQREYRKYTRNSP